MVSSRKSAADTRVKTDFEMPSSPIATTEIHEDSNDADEFKNVDIGLQRGPRKFIPVLLFILLVTSSTWSYLRATLPEDRDLILYDYLEEVIGKPFNVEFEDHEDTTRGVVASKGFRESDEVIFIPKKYCYTVKNSPQTLRDLWTRSANGHPPIRMWKHVVVLTGLIYEKYHTFNSDSHHGWRSLFTKHLNATEAIRDAEASKYVDIFINALPTQEELINVGSWVGNYHEFLIGGLELYRNLIRAGRTAFRYLQFHLSALLDEEPQLQLQETHWAAGVTYARGFTISEKHPSVIIPVMNMIRFTWNPDEANVRAPVCESHGCTMTALKRIRKGDFLVAHRGPDTNFAMLVHYGNYLSGNNPFAEFVFHGEPFPEWMDAHHCFNTQRLPGFIPVLGRQLPRAYDYMGLDETFRCRTIAAYGQELAQVAKETDHHKSFTLERVRTTRNGHQFWKHDFSVAVNMSDVCKERMREIESKISSLTLYMRYKHSEEEHEFQNIVTYGTMPKDRPGEGLGKKILYALVHERKKMEKSILLLENLKRNLEHGYTEMEKEICKETGDCPEEDGAQEDVDAAVSDEATQEDIDNLAPLDEDTEL